MLGPDEIGYYSFPIEGEGNPKDLLGIDKEQLKRIQEDIQERLRERDVHRKQCSTKDKGSRTKL